MRQKRGAYGAFLFLGLRGFFLVLLGSEGAWSFAVGFFFAARDRFFWGGSGFRENLKPSHGMSQLVGKGILFWMS